MFVLDHIVPAGILVLPELSCPEPSIYPFGLDIEVLPAARPSMSNMHMAVFMNTYVHTPSQSRCQYPFCGLRHLDAGSLRGPCYVGHRLLRTKLGFENGH